MHLKKFQIIILLLILTSGNYLFSQQAVDLSNISSHLGSTHAGKEFWLTFHPNYSNDGGSAGVYIFITSKFATTVTLEIPGKFIQQKQTVPYKVIYFQIPFTLAQPINIPNTQAPPSEQVYNQTGIHVYSDDEIVVFCTSTTNGSADGFVAYPLSTLGRDYVVASWQGSIINNQILPSFTSVVAAFDQTRVSVIIGGTTDTQTTGGMKTGDPKSWTLYKGDVLVIGSSGRTADLSGTNITSSKPVAVISGNRCGTIPDNATGCDYLIEQDIPTSAWGKVYYIAPFYLRTKNSYIKIFSKDADNSVYRDGSLIASFSSKGIKESEGWISMRADEGSPRPVVISGDKPILVTQYNSSRSEDRTGIDPFQMNLLCEEQFQTETFFAPPRVEGGVGFTINYLNIIYQPTADGLMPDSLMIGYYENQKLTWHRLIDIDPSPGKSFYNLPGHKRYNYKTIPISNISMYTFKSPTPIQVYSYGSSQRDAYGYAAGASLRNLERNDTLAPNPVWIQTCDGNVAKADVTDLPADLERSNLSVCFFHNELSYNYTYQQTDFQPGDFSKTKWSLTVKNPSLDARAVITFGDRCGNDTTIVINYYVTNLSLNNKNTDFGVLKRGDTLTKYFTLKNNSTTAAKTIDSLFIMHNENGFELLRYDSTRIILPIQLKPNDSLRLALKFTNSAIGKYYDTLIAKDLCNSYVLGNIKAEVGGPTIEVSDKTFNDTPIGKTTVGQVTINNRGLTDLVIKSVILPSMTEFQPELPEINSLQPLIINPSKNFYFNVYFKPLADSLYQDSIVFISDASTKDSACTLKGKGFKIINVDEDINPKDADLELYPNPAKDILNIKIQNPQLLGIKIKVYDNNGNLVDNINSPASTNKSNFTIVYNTSKLANGLYVLRLQTGETTISRSFTILR